MKPLMQAAMKHQKATQLSSMPTITDPTTPELIKYYSQTVHIFKKLIHTAIDCGPHIA